MVQSQLRTAARSYPHQKSANANRSISPEELASLRAYRRNRVASRMLPHQPKAA